MAVRDQTCRQCGMLNCSRHGNLLNSITNRLTNLLEYFESPDEDMRTFIQPEKTKTPTTNRPDNLGGTTESSFKEKLLPQQSAAETITPMPKSNEITGREIVHIGPACGESFESRTAQSSSSASNTNHISRPEGVSRLGHGKGYKAHERHHFVRIQDVSFTSCTSPSSTYAETSLVLWLDSKPFHKYSHSTDKYRVVISIMYDSEDDLWSVSSKLLKRSGYYSQKDEEEGHIQNRLCITSELRTEVKKMLLFLGISPRQAYKMFRRNVDEKFIISSSDYGFTTVESASHSKLMKDLEKSSSSSSSSTGHFDAHGGYYGPYGHMHPRHRMRDRDARQPTSYADLEGWGMD